MDFEKTKHRISDRMPVEQIDVWGMNSPSDFVDNFDYLPDDMQFEARRAIENRIMHTFDISGSIDEYGDIDLSATWERWCNEEIIADFSDIQQEINNNILD